MTMSFDHYPGFVGLAVAVELVVVEDTIQPDLYCCPAVGRVMKLMAPQSELELPETADLE